MTLKKGIVASQRQMRQKKVRFAGKYNPVLQKLSGNKDFTSAVNKPSEWRKINELVKKEAEGGLYRKELQGLADKLAHGNEASEFSRKEGRQIAKAFQEEFYSDLKKYKSSRPDFKSRPEHRAGRTDAVPKNDSAASIGKQLTPTGMAKIMNKIRTGSPESSENENDENPKGGFSGAMASTMRNRKG